MFGFSKEYVARLPVRELDSDSPVFEIADTGNWHSFLWDRMSQSEYSKSPPGWLDLHKLENLSGNDLVLSGVARSEHGKHVIKVEFIKHFRKKNNLEAEGNIISSLNEQGCVTAPKLLSHGSLPVELIKHMLPPDLLISLEQSGATSFGYLVLEHVESARKCPLADILVALLEQKSLGWYHADVKPENIRYDVRRGLCTLIDYDQALPVPEHIREMSAEEFLQWCDMQDKKMYPVGPGTWRRHFKGLKLKRHVQTLLKNGAFNLESTTPYKRQATTNTKSGVYHSIRHKSVYVDGVRDLKERSLLLDQIEFNPGESVLDVGCNGGLLVHYLASRGCLATGIELDRSIVVSAQMVSNILGINARFMAVDMDEVDKLEKVDTVCLFSVIHHTKNLQANGAKVANACNRILIECRLSERGKKPIVATNNRVIWEDTSAWNYPDEQSLYEGLSGLFPGFFVSRKVGQSDKNRVLLEMKKHNA
jgi:SAM-dependent methyltransferase